MTYSKAPKLPLLKFTANLHPDVSLEDVYIIGEQHIVSSTFELIKALFKKGLRPQNLLLIGKCYSTNPYIYAQMVQAGIDVSIASLAFDPNEDFDAQYRKYVLNLYKRALPRLNLKKIKKVIIMSDGGALQEIANTLPLNDLSKIVGVEQTTSGYENLKSKKLQFPIINVARSDTKLRHESPFIARLTVERLFLSLNALNIHPKKILVIGNGSVGAQICSILKDDFNISTFDVIPSKSSISNKDFEDSLSQFDLIIGATGKRTISSNQYKYLKKNAVLASVSSSDREFDAVYLRRKFKGTLTDCHQHLLVDNIYLMNCGFPVIFDTSYDIIDTSEFQLTRSLLLTGVLQGVDYRGSDKGFISLDPEDQREIVQELFSSTQIKSRKQERSVKQ